MNVPISLSNVPERLRLRVEDFLLLNDNGAFAEYHKTELIDGEIFYMNAQHSDHARVKSRLLVELALALRTIGSDLEAICEVTIRAADDSAPEPDIVLTRWLGGGVVPIETVAMVVEVSDSTLDRDLGRKLALYAAAGLSEYWVVDVNERRILVHSRPEADSYAERGIVPFGDPIVSAAVDGPIVDSAVLCS